MNEDLNAQLLTRCINEGKTLVNDTKEKSLATELEHLTKEEVKMELLVGRTMNMTYIVYLASFNYFFLGGGVKIAKMYSFIPKECCSLVENTNFK